MIKVMFIGGRLHRQFREVESDGFGTPSLAIYRNPMPPSSTECEQYHKRRVIVDPDSETKAVVYLLEGIEEYYFQQAYLEEPGIMDQLKELAK